MKLNEILNENFNEKFKDITCNIYKKYFDTNIFDNLKIFKKLINIISIFLGETIKFNLNNLLNKYIFFIPKNERIELIKSITYKLEKINMLYIKIFQSLCLENDYLYENEKAYLLKYIDKVPYNIEDIDYDLLNALQRDFNIIIENTEPINAGIIGIVFEGFDINNNSKIVVKLLKKNIKSKLNDFFNELDFLTYFTNYIPYINSLKLNNFVNDTREILLNQANFENEVINTEFFKFKFENLIQYKIPFVNKEITNKYNNVIVMENIRGLTINDIKNMDIKIKNEFGILIIKFGLLQTLFKNVIHCDFHAGNIFFYMNDNDSLLPKYQIGIIDFGICCFPKKESQNSFFNFFDKILLKKEKNINILITTIIDLINEKEIFQSYDKKIQEYISTECINIINKIQDSYNFKLFISLTILLKKYNITFNKDFNNAIFSVLTANTLTKELCEKYIELQEKCFNELIEVNNLLKID